MSASNLDLIVAGKTYYMATLAPKIWFIEEELHPLYEWFSTHSQVVGFTEQAQLKHLHVLFSSDTKVTGHVTRSLERLFTRHDIPWTKGVTIDVRKSSVPIGHFHYLTDELKEGTQVLLKGWRMSWIQEQCRANLKLKPRKLLRKDVYVVNNVDGPALIIQYANLHHLPICDKRTFINVLSLMTAEKYTFHAVKTKHLAIDTLALCGCTRVVASFWDNELMFLEC